MMVIALLINTNGIHMSCVNQLLLIMVFDAESYASGGLSCSDGCCEKQ
jgi:hypothetical protein